MIEYPFGISGGVFSSIADDSTLYVPQGKKDAYESTNYWKHYFSNIVELNAMGISEVKPRQTAEGYAVYDLNGKKVSVKGGGLKSLPHGIYVVNGKNCLWNSEPVSSPSARQKPQRAGKNTETRHRVPGKLPDTRCGLCEESFFRRK